MITGLPRYIVEKILLEQTLLLIEGLSVLANITLLIIYWRRSEKSFFLGYCTFFQVFVSIYVTSHMLIHFGGALEIQVVYLRYIKGIFYVFSQITCLLLCWIFINSQKKLDKRIFFVFIVPAVYTLLMLTNNWHQLFGRIYSQYTNGFMALDFKKSPLCIGVETMAYLTVMPFVFRILLHLSRQRGYVLKQALLVFSAGLIPMLANTYDLFFGITLLDDFDLVPVITGVCSFLFAVAALKYKLLNLVSSAFSEFVEHLKAAILILDKGNRVIYFNTVFSQAFPILSGIKRYENAAHVMEKLRDSMVKPSEIQSIEDLLSSSNFSDTSVEVNLEYREKKAFQVSIQPIIAYGNETIGKILSFNDITDYRNLLDEVGEKNSRLSEAYDKLKEHAATVEELAVTKERNRLARDAHDTLGHTMTSLITLLDMSRINFHNNPAKALEELEDAVRAAREGQKGLRDSIYCITHTGFDGIKGLKLLESMLSNFRGLGVNVDFSIEGNGDIENCKLWETIYRICQEALTNAVRHGKAQNVTIILKFAAKSVKIYILDDGRGCGEIKKGIGLSGMEQRVAALCGVIVYGSGEDGGGFNINVQIPVESS